MPSAAEITRHHVVSPPEGCSAWIAAKRPRVGIEMVVADTRWPVDFTALSRRIRERWVQFCGPDCPETIRHLIFRDWLREHRDDRALYQATKLNAASDSNSAGEHVMDYNARKEPVIRAVYDRAFRAADLL